MLYNFSLRVEFDVNNSVDSEEPMYDHGDNEVPDVCSLSLT